MSLPDPSGQFPVPSRDFVTLLIFIIKKVNDFHLIYDFLSIDLAAVISVCKKSQRILQVHSNKYDKFYQTFDKTLLNRPGVAGAVQGLCTDPV